jgi:hypothetical protein
LQKDIDTYASKYPGLTGIFFDEVSASASDISFYTQAYNYVMQKGYSHSILNPGVVPAAGYVDVSLFIYFSPFSLFQLWETPVTSPQKHFIFKFLFFLKIPFDEM